MKALATVRVMSHGVFSVASLTGEIDLSNVDGIETQLLTPIPNTARAVVIDLGATTYLDSRGVQMLLSVVDRLHTRRQKVYLALPESSVLRRLLEILSVTRTLNVEMSVNAAIDRVQGEFPA